MQQKNVIKTIEYDELVKKVNTIDSNKILKKKIKNVDRKISDTSKFIVTQDFNRLINMNFNSRTGEASKNLATKKQVENALDLGDNNREKIIFERLI